MKIIEFFKKLVGIFKVNKNKVYYVGNQETLPRAYTFEEEQEKISQLLEGKEGVKDELIAHNLRLVVYIARKFDNTGVDLDDLISVGTIGLIKAVNTFKNDKNIKLATYASRCIENEILMLLRANKKHKSDVSLSDPVGTDKDGNELTLMELLCEKEDMVFLKVDRSIEREKFLQFIKGVLSEREYTVLCLRYGLKGGRVYAQREVARFLKISRSYISRIEKKAIEKLKGVVKKGQFYC